MQVTFDINKFEGNARALTDVLYHLKQTGTYFDPNKPEITSITCKTPSSAYRYARYVCRSGISEKAERVFLKNPNIAIKYLSMVRKKQFSNDDTQKRFWRKVVKNPYFAYEWANAFNSRLSEQEEEIFIDHMKLVRDYAWYVIKGKFPEKIHNILLLKSFELKEGWEKGCLQEYIKYVS